MHHYATKTTKNEKKQNLEIPVIGFGVETKFRGKA